jgi:hypothetical protein
MFPGSNLMPVNENYTSVFRNKKKKLNTSVMGMH